MTAIEMIKEIVSTPFDFAEDILNVVQVASLPALSIGGSAVMATALLDHIGVVTVMNDPALLQRGLEIAAAAAIVRVVAFLRGSGIQTAIVTSAWCPLTNRTCRGPRTDDAGPPSSPRAR